MIMMTNDCLPYSLVPLGMCLSIEDIEVYSPLFHLVVIIIMIINNIKLVIIPERLKSLLLFYYSNLDLTFTVALGPVVYLNI